MGTLAVGNMTIAGIGIGAAISGNTTTVRVGDAVTAKIASRRPASLGCLHWAYRFALLSWRRECPAPTIALRAALPPVAAPIAATNWPDPM
jgi:hypothetical protein